MIEESELIVENKVIDTVYLIGDSNTDVNINDLNVPPSERRLGIFKNYRDKYSTNDQNRRLYKILDDSKCYFGNIILYKWAYDKDLSNFRKVLASIVVDDQLARNKYWVNPFEINHNQFETLNQEILELFPSESKNLYYERGFFFEEDKQISKNGGEKHFSRVNTSGLLYRAYINKRACLKKAALLDIKPKSSKRQPVDCKTSTSIDLSILFNEVNDDNNDIANVKETWMKSYEFRQIQYPDRGISHVEKFQVLKSYIAPTLVEYDFNQKHGNIYNTSNAVRSKWFSTFDSIIEHTREKLKLEIHNSNEDISDISLSADSLLNVFRKINSIMRNEDAKSIVALFCLPWILDYSPRKSDLPPEYRPKKVDKINSFIRHIVNHDNLYKLIYEVNNKYDSFSINTPQPFIIICGALNNSSCCHVVIKDYTYNFTNIITAVDFLFRFLIVLKIPYPVNCSHVWTYIQRHIYKLETVRKNVAKRQVDELDSALNSLNRKRCK